MPDFFWEDYSYFDYDSPLATFGTAPGQIELLDARTSYPDISWGDSLPPPEVTKMSPGDEMLVRLAFHAKKPPTDDWSLFIHLVDWSGLTVAQVDTMPGGGLRPTSDWPRYGVLLEDYLLTIPRTAYTPNRAHLQVGFYNHRTGERLPLEEGSSSYSFGAIAIPSSEDEVDVPIPIHVQFADNVVLAAYRFSSRHPVRGEEMTVTLYWTASGPVAESYTIFAHLLTTSFKMHGGADLDPRPPTEEWVAGETVETVHTFTVPADAPAGRYQIEIGLYTLPDFRRLRVLDRINPAEEDRILIEPLRIR